MKRKLMLLMLLFLCASLSNADILIDDFENYTDTTALRTASYPHGFYNSDGDPDNYAALEIATADSYDGDQHLYVHGVNNSDYTYGPYLKASGSTVWNFSGMSAVRVYVKAAQKNNGAYSIRLRMKEGSTSDPWVYDESVTSVDGVAVTELDEWTAVDFDISALLDTDKDNITYILFTVYKDPASDSKMYMDDLKVVGGAGSKDVLDDFETYDTTAGLIDSAIPQSFPSGDSSDNNATIELFETDSYSYGSQCIRVTEDRPGNVYTYFSMKTYSGVKWDWSDVQKFRFYFKEASGGNCQMKLYLDNDNVRVWDSEISVTADASDWNMAEWDVSTIADSDCNDITDVIIRLQNIDTGTPGVWLLDNFETVKGPKATVETVDDVLENYESYLGTADLQSSGSGHSVYYYNNGNEASKYSNILIDTSDPYDGDKCLQALTQYERGYSYLILRPGVGVTWDWSQYEKLRFFVKGEEANGDYDIRVRLYKDSGWIVPNGGEVMLSGVTDANDWTSAEIDLTGLADDDIRDLYYLHLTIYKPYNCRSSVYFDSFELVKPVSNTGFSYEGLPCQMAMNFAVSDPLITPVTLKYGLGNLDNIVAIPCDPSQRAISHVISDLTAGENYNYEIEYNGQTAASGDFIAESIMPETFIVEDFESYVNSDCLRNTDSIYGSSVTTKTLIDDADFAYEGSKCAKFQKSAATYMYVGVNRSLDLSDYDKLRIWYKGDTCNGSFQEIQFRVRNGLTYFVTETANTYSDNNRWNSFDIPIDSDPNWASVDYIFARVSSEDDRESVIYLDRIEAIRDVVLPADYDDNLVIDTYDLNYLASLWLVSYDLMDFSVLASRWSDDYSCGFEVTDLFVSNNGVGDGLSRSNPASYTDMALWGMVDVALRNNPVAVWFLDGTYDGAESLMLEDIGNAANLLTVKGESADGVVFNPVSTTTSRMIGVDGCENIRLENLNFTGSIAGYCISIGKSSKSVSHDIEVVNCSFHDMPEIMYGVTGVHYASHDVLFQNCTFKRAGYDQHAHFIYNAYNAPYNITIDGCHFEDCAGAAIKFRDGGNGSVVTNCTFLSTGTYTYHPQGRVIAILAATHTNRDPDVIEDDEYFGTNYTITGNTFTFNSSTPVRSVLEYYHSGYDPRGYNPNSSDNLWHYIMDPADGAILEGTDSAAKRSLLYNDCGIDYNQITLSGNTYSGHTAELLFESLGIPSQGWDDSADISDILN